MNNTHISLKEAWPNSFGIYDELDNKTIVYQKFADKSDIHIVYYAGSKLMLQVLKKYSKAQWLWNHHTEHSFNRIW